MKSGGAWTLPGVALDEEESVREAALSALDEHGGDDASAPLCIRRGARRRLGF